MKPFGIPRDAIRPNGFFAEAIVNSATGSKSFLVLSAPLGASGDGARWLERLRFLRLVPKPRSAFHRRLRKASLCASTKPVPFAGHPQSAVPCSPTYGD